MKFLKLWGVCLLALAALLTLSSCGGETKTTTTEPADGCDHVFTDRVVEPTCVDDGFTVHTCDLCGYKFTDNKIAKTGKHVWERRTVLPSVKTDVYGIDAMNYDAEICSGCGKATYYTANLINLTFDDASPIPEDYVPSENYEIAMEMLAAEAAELKLTGDEASARIKNWVQMLKLIDSQKHLTCWETGSGIRGAYIENEALIGYWQFFIHDDLALFSDAPKIDTFTLTFDLTINGEPSRWTENHGYAPIFGVCGGAATGGGAKSMWRSPCRLELTRYPNSSGEYELIASYATGAADNWTFVPTGAYLELGKAYTFKMEVDRTKWPAGENKPYYTLSYKEVGAEYFIELGDYTYYPSNEISGFKIFDPGCAVGNVFDNFKVFVQLEEE